MSRNEWALRDNNDNGQGGGEGSVFVAYLNMVRSKDDPSAEQVTKVQ